MTTVATRRRSVIAGVHGRLRSLSSSCRGRLRFAVVYVHARPLGARLGDVGRFGCPAAVRDALEGAGQVVEGVGAEDARAPRRLSTRAGSRRHRDRRVAAVRRGIAVAPPVRDRPGVRPRRPRVRGPRDLPRRRARSAAVRLLRARRAGCTRRTIHAATRPVMTRTMASHTYHGTKSIASPIQRTTGSRRSPSQRSGPRNGRGAGSLRKRRSSRIRACVRARRVRVDCLRDASDHAGIASAARLASSRAIIICTSNASRADAQIEVEDDERGGRERQRDRGRDRELTDCAMTSAVALSLDWMTQPSPAASPKLSTVIEQLTQPDHAERQPEPRLGLRERAAEGL